MTKVEMIHNGNKYEVKILGHAGYAKKNAMPAGCDIVCAAISLTSYTMVQRVKDMENEGKLISSEITIDSGIVIVGIISKEKYNNELFWTLETIKTAFELLAETYPEHVSLTLGWGNIK